MAASKPVDANIPDDWEEVDDDSFSVVSLPTSEDGLVDKIRLPLRPKTPEPSRSPRSREETAEDNAEDFGVNLPAVRSGNEGGTGRNKPSRSARLDQHLDEIPKVKFTPDIFHRVFVYIIPFVKGISVILDTGIPVILDTGVEARILGDWAKCTSAGADRLKAECKRLTRQLQVLEPIVLGYTRNWRLDAAIPFPLDPGLSEWASSLEVELHALQSQLVNHLNKKTASVTNISQISEHHSPVLANFTGQLEALNIVLRADYYQYFAADALVSLDSPSPCHDLPELEKNWREKAVYDLKDQICDCLRELEAHEESVLSINSDETRAISELVGSYRNIKSSLDLILRNLASDWVDYGLEGVLTYAEFCRINPELVRSLNLDLKAVVDDLSLERGRLLSLRYSNDPDDILEGETLCVKRTDIDKLRSIGDFIISVFQIQKPSQSCAGPAGSQPIQVSND
ncbi:hypothetical protein GGR56DRAFT_649948 [Xylariaceae sp. FL0804]|nr:hypothetical protein GGR56DRAFT_649948 [Xylariaceae sp. FL0804]